MCLRGASEIQTKVLEKIKNPDLSVYAVYLPILPGDKETTVRDAMKRVPDGRVRYFWDGKSELAKDYSSVLQLPGDRPAWDIYMVFNRDAEWGEGDPPRPDYWMHQLGGVSPERQLDGAKLAGEINKLLEEGKR